MSAWKSVLIISCVTVICVGIALFGLKRRGLNFQYTEFEHPFFESELSEQNRPLFLVAQGGGAGEAPGNTFTAFDRALKLDPKIILEMDVRQSKDGQLILFGEEVLDHQTDGQGLVSGHSVAELRGLDAGFGFVDAHGGHPFRGKGIKIPLLTEALTRYSEGRIVLDIQSNVVDIHKKVVSILQENDAWRRVLVQSDHDVIVTSIRKLKPKWLFGTGTGELARVLMMDSLFLIPAVSIWGDVFVAPALRKGQRIIETSLVNEVHRRSRRIFLSSVNSLETLKESLELGVDGIMTDRPTYIYRQLALVSKRY